MIIPGPGHPYPLKPNDWVGQLVAASDDTGYIPPYPDGADWRVWVDAFTQSSGDDFDVPLQSDFDIWTDWVEAFLRWNE